MSNPVPGWYPDSVTPGQQRYWDGAQWTEHVAPLPPAAQPHQPAPYYGYGAPGYAPTYAQPHVTGPYAHWGLRVASYLLDTLLVLPFVVIALVLQLTHTQDEWVDGRLVSIESPTGSVLALIWACQIAGFAISMWNVAYRQGTTGYSVGKQVVGIKLVREQDGRVLGGWPAFGRNILHILDGLSLFIGYLWPLWDAKRQTFADKCMHTVVIVEPKPKA